MKFEIDLRSAALGLLAAASAALLLGAVRQDKSAPVNTALIGRYQLAVGGDLSAVIVLDTTNGRTWSWRAPGADSTWEFAPMGQVE